MWDSNPGLRTWVRRAFSPLKSHAGNRPPLPGVFLFEGRGLWRQRPMCTGDGGTLTLCFPHKRKRLRAGMLPGLPEVEVMWGVHRRRGSCSPRSHGRKVSRLACLLSPRWCTGRGGRNWAITSGRGWGWGWDMAWPDAPHGGHTGKLHLTLTSAAWRPVPPPSPKRASGSLPGWAFIPLNREIGNEP